MSITLVVLLSAVVAAALNWRFGSLPNVAATLLGCVWLLRLRRMHPPRPERVRAVAAIFLGNSIGFLTVWGGGIVTRLIAKPVVTAPQKPRNPMIDRAEALVNEGVYDQAAKLLQGCVADECTVILMRIAHETGSPEPASSGDAP